MKQKLALVQMDIAPGDPKINFARVSKWIMEAAYTNVDVVVLPELWDTGFAGDDLHTTADYNANATVEFLSDMAAHHHINIVGGSIAEETGAGLHNTMLVINSDGDLIHKYSKQHLQQTTDESSYFTPGQASFSFTLNGVPSLGIISSDSHFLSEDQSSSPAVIYIVAEWTRETVEEQFAIWQAYAMDNNCYVVVCNRTGNDAVSEYGGMSSVITPAGEKLTEGGYNEKMIVTTIQTNPSESSS